MDKLMEQLYVLKNNAVDHIKSQRYHSASIYLQDTLRKFQEILQHPLQESSLEKLIKEIKFSSHKNLSLCFLKLKKYIQCIQECKKVLQVEPNNVKFIYRIGKAHMQLQQYNQAEEYFKRGFHLDPHEKQIMKQLQELQRHKNNIKPIVKTKQPIVLFKIKTFIVFLIMILPLLSIRFAEKIIIFMGLQSYNQKKIKKQ